jgi:hypothetical protein
MKNVAVLLAIALVVGMTAMSNAAILNVSNQTRTTVSIDVTRGVVSDTVNGDANGWRGTFNNSKDTGGGSTANADNWGTGTGDCALFAPDKSELQSVVTAAGTALDAWMLVPERNAVTGTPNMVAGIFTADNIQWSSTALRYNKANDAGDQWKYSGTSYADFEAMVAAGVLGGGAEVLVGAPFTTPILNLGTDAAGQGGNTNAVIKIHIGPEMVRDYLNGAFSGFFVSNTDTTVGGVTIYGGTQWSNGIGSPSLMVTPEPATMVLLILGGLALIRRRNA